MLIEVLEVSKLSCRDFTTALLLSDLPVQAEKNRITAKKAEVKVCQNILFINGGFNEEG
jgi:hypothetical protein